MKIFQIMIAISFSIISILNFGTSEACNAPNFFMVNIVNRNSPPSLIGTRPIPKPILVKSTDENCLCGSGLPADGQEIVPGSNFKFYISSGQHPVSQSGSFIESCQDTKITYNIYAQNADGTYPSSPTATYTVEVPGSLNFNWDSVKTTPVVKDMNYTLDQFKGEPSSTAPNMNATVTICNATKSCP